MIAVGFHQMRFESTLKDMVACPALLVAADAKRGQKTLHEPAQIRFTGTQIKMKVIGHVAIGIHDYVKLGGELSQICDKIFIMQIVMKHHTARIAAINDVITRIREFNSKRSSHNHSLSQET